MKKTYFVLLKNNYLVPFSKKPTKRGNYLAGVKLFISAKDASCEDLISWKDSNYEHEKFTEVTDWE